jgi:GT2 family glycosyltransferase
MPSRENPRVFVAIPTMHPHILRDNVLPTLALVESDVAVDLLVFENGCRLEPGIENPRGAVTVLHSDVNLGVPRALDALYRAARAASGDDEFVIGFLHDDVCFYEPWVRKVLAAFTDPNVVLAGPAAGLVHGHPTTTAEHVEGLLYRGRPFLMNSVPPYPELGIEPCAFAREAAVLDGLAIFARGSFLDGISGFTFWPEPHHGYDHAISAMARRRGGRIAYVPISTEHFGRADEERAAFERDLPLEPEFWRLGSPTHRRALRTLWELFSDVLPYSVEGRTLHSLSG